MNDATPNTETPLFSYLRRRALRARGLSRAQAAEALKIATALYLEGQADAARISWLEREANTPGGILLHAEIEPTGRCGLGLQPGGRRRTLRQAIDQVRQADGVEVPE